MPETRPLRQVVSSGSPCEASIGFSRAADVIRTRSYLVAVADWEAIGSAPVDGHHGGAERDA